MCIDIWSDDAEMKPACSICLSSNLSIFQENTTKSPVGVAFVFLVLLQPSVLSLKQIDLHFFISLA